MTMQSRRDLFQAHRLMTQRASLALLRGEPDVPDQPLRRHNVATFCALLVAAIACAGFAIWGILGHTGGTLQNQAGTLIVDKGTGQSYVFCNSAKEICPVVNYASARLELQSDTVNQQTVSQGALANYTRGPEIGIAGLPDLPDSSLLVKQPWSVCAQQTSVPGSGLQTITTLAAGISTGGSPLGSGALLAESQGQNWVIWNSQRMAIQQANLHALSGASPVSVPTQWLDALPQGPAFAPPAIPDQGQTAAGPAGSPVRVGQVYSVPVAGGTQYYVMLTSGLATISQTQSRLLEFEPNAPAPATLTPSQVTGHLSKATVPGGGLPPTIPQVTTPNSAAALCVDYTAAGGSSTLNPAVSVGGQVPAGVSTGQAADVSQVALPPGTAALVGDAPGPGQGNTPISYFLVASGRRYALSETEVAGFLGYSLSQAVLMPAGVVDLIPAGPALNPAQAAKPVPSGG
jgi:type VII secretion protein EccB